MAISRFIIEFSNYLDDYFEKKVFTQNHVLGSIA